MLMQILNPFDINPEQTNLIEASAGTGKTYTITTLYCRLAALGYPVESILVVTFTEAAAAELKLRIRDRLSSTYSFLADHAGDAAEDLSAEDDLCSFFASQPEQDIIRRRLKLALICFDQAAVMTIHSFCFKVLKENAFESRALFDVELMPDRSVFLRQVSQDFFLKYINNQDSLFLRYLQQKNISPDSFIKAFNSIVSRPGICLKPKTKKTDIPFDSYRKILGEIRDIILKDQEKLAELIQKHQGVDKRSYSKKNVPKWLFEIHQTLEQNKNDILFKMTEKGDPLYKFTITRLTEKTKAGKEAPAHRFFDLCEQLLEFENLFAARLINLKTEFLSFFASELEQMKMSKGIYFFDDLINDLAAALKRKQGQALIRAVRKNFKACLIDEFQDTDPVQYEIFSRLFRSQGTPFFMIGDPKQAIYGFRGGDIFAYLKASKQADQKFTLETNYRSSPLLVKAVNSIFSNEKNPFFYDAISFFPVTTPDTSPEISINSDRLIENDGPVPPFQLLFVPSNNDNAEKNSFTARDEAEKQLPSILARDMLALFNSKKRLKENPENEEEFPSQKINRQISPGDIAVLVRTNRQAAMIQDALSFYNIPSYLSGTASVFDSKEAMDIYDILLAVNEPLDKGKLFAALATSVFAHTSTDIEELNMDEDLYFQRQDNFREYKDIWEKKGFISMMMAVFHSKAAFLRENSGLSERKLTNFYHLAELISQAALKRKLSPHYLLKWYSRQLSSASREENQGGFSVGGLKIDELRLESDRQAVAIMTIHKSKGLEFPVVYLPFLWEKESRTAKENILFHDPENEQQLTLDLGSDDFEKSRSCLEYEESAEARRLLYVALTRASSLCRVIWGRYKGVLESSLGTILHKNKAENDESMIQDIQNLADKSKDAIQVDILSRKSVAYKVTQEQEAKNLICLPVNRKVVPAWKISSFSGLTRLHEYEEANLAVTSPKQQSEQRTGCRITLAGFPGGTETGDFFHWIFENLSFSEDKETILSLINSVADRFSLTQNSKAKALNPNDQLKKSDKSDKLPEQAAQSIKEVLNTKLLNGDSGFCLKDIPDSQRINEMEFMFPTKNFSISEIQQLMESSKNLSDRPANYAKSLSGLSPGDFKGFFKGFIDLVFVHQGKYYIIDYKSNNLGDTYSSYSPEHLNKAMADHHYFLQYYIYTMALHRYLSLRLTNYDYDTHLGGVFYLFIRGMHPDFGPETGVFFDKPVLVR